MTLNCFKGHRAHRFSQLFNLIKDVDQNFFFTNFSYIGTFLSLFPQISLSVCNKINYVWCTTAYPHERKSKTKDFSFKKAISACFRCSKGINLPYRIALEDCDN